jgi:hypothetical protein
MYKTLILGTVHSFTLSLARGGGHNKNYFGFVAYYCLFCRFLSYFSLPSPILEV